MMSLFWGFLGNSVGVHGADSPGSEAGDPGGGPLSAGLSHCVQEGSKVIPTDQTFVCSH